MKNPAISKIVSMQRDARIWGGITVIQTLLFTAVIAYLKFFPTPQQDVLVVHEGGYIVGKLEDFDESTQLHENQSEVAALCLFQRTPNGLEYKDRMERLFGTEAYKKAIDQISIEMNEFQLKSLHQKLEIFEIKTLQARGDFVLTNLKGQLIRAGLFEGESFVEVLQLDLKMQFVRNPDLVSDRSYPSIVTDFEFATTPIRQ